MKNKILLIISFILLSLSIASAQIDSVKTISGGVLNGKAKNLVAPDYPAAAKAVKAEGAVNVQVTIDEEGNVISATAVSGHPLLRAAAEKAARESTFSPTRLSGQPVKVTGVIVYNFTNSSKTEQTPESKYTVSPTDNNSGTAVGSFPADGKSVINGGVVNGKALSLAKPSYPAAAQAVRASGAVNVRVTIDEVGNVIAAEAISGHPLLRAASVSAARESRFSPTMLEGQPVKVTGIIVYNYMLPMSWSQIGYELSLAEKSRSLDAFQISSIAGTFPENWSDEKEDLTKLIEYLRAKSEKGQSPAKMSEPTEKVSSNKAAPPKGTFVLGSEEMNEATPSKGTFVLSGSGSQNYSLDNYSAENLKQLQFKVENRLAADTNKLWYFNAGKVVGKIVAEIEDETKTRANAQELNLLLVSVPPGVSDSFIANIKLISEISEQNISSSDKKEKMIAVIKRLQDN